jgi:HD-GYP domain-containing protein (c-di-GMP phosphodiesterase class II)
MSTLETAVEVVGDELGAHTAGVFALLTPLRTHNVEAYRHSLRVCLLSSRLAAHLHASGTDVDPRLAFYGGALHDVGKLDVHNRVLRAEHFGEAERSAIEVHAWSGYARVALAGFPRAALVVGLHHAFQDRPYGLSPEQCGDETAVQTARCVAMCDFFDALTTRNDGRFDHQDRQRPKDVLTLSFPDHAELAGWLVEIGSRAVA